MEYAKDFDVVLINDISETSCKDAALITDTFIKS